MANRCIGVVDALPEIGRQFELKFSIAALVGFDNRVVKVGLGVLENSSADPVIEAVLAGKCGWIQIRFVYDKPQIEEVERDDGLKERLPHTIGVVREVKFIGYRQTQFRSQPGDAVIRLL